ncbi:uncharacterized protein LOC128954244 [Oppia nitens]|uniref:uncharacterized protein LOC128954244 n=1 Tax=Oppia nitens TaxID=1686743 RepID=UPI0023D99848|nr:uncharacterized protein LOC128954244 [Oppia nitens]
MSGHQIAAEAAAAVIDDQLIVQVRQSETSQQLATAVRQLSKAIVQHLLSAAATAVTADAAAADTTNDGQSVVVEAFRAITAKAVPNEPDYRTAAATTHSKTAASKALIVFDNIRQLLIKVDGQRLPLDRQVITELLFMIVAHWSPSGGGRREWSSPEVYQNKCKCLELVLKITETKTVGDLLNRKYNLSLVRSLLAKLKTNVAADGDNEWLSVASNSLIFEWIVHNIDRIDATNYLYDIFPLTVQLLDDHLIPNKIIGCKCLQQLLTTTTTNHCCWPDLRSNGSDLLIVDRLKRLLYYKEAELMEIVLQLIINVMLKTSDDYSVSPKQQDIIVGGGGGKHQELTAMSRNDEFCCQVLNNLLISSDRNYRIIHLKFLDQFFPMVNSLAIKYTKTYINLLLNLIDDQSSSLSSSVGVKNYRLIEVTINSLNIFVGCVWPTIHEFIDRCLLSLVKLSVNAMTTTTAAADSDLTADFRHKLRQQICESISLLKSVDKTDRFKQLSERLIQSQYKHMLNESILTAMCC